MRRERKAKASAGWAALGCAVALGAAGGCSSLQTGDDWSLTKSMDFDLRRKIPWTTAAESEAKQAGKLIAIWTDATLHQEGAPSMRGFGGRLMFYPSKGGEAVKVDGELTVYAYIEEGGAPRSEQPDRKFVFTSEQLAKVESKTNLGHSYSVWLPWGPTDGETLHMSLIARFQPKAGQAIVGEQTKNLLPGKDDPHERARRMAASRAAQPNAPTPSQALQIQTLQNQALQNQMLQNQALKNQGLPNSAPPNPFAGQTSFAPPADAAGSFPQPSPPNPFAPTNAAANPWPAAPGVPLQEVHPVSLQTLPGEAASATRMQTSTYTLARGLPPAALGSSLPAAAASQVPPAAYGNGVPPTAYGGHPPPHAQANVPSLPGTASLPAAAPLSDPTSGAQPVLAWGSPATVNPADAPTGWNAGPQPAPAAAGWGRHAADAAGGDSPAYSAANSWRRERTVGAPIPNVTRSKPIWRNP